MTLQEMIEETKRMLAECEKALEQSRELLKEYRRLPLD